MRTLFADAGYWIALLYSGDQLHERATTVAAGLGPVAIVTTQMALAEALNHLAGRGERLRRLAAQMVRELEARSDVQVIPQTDAQFRAAVEHYAARADQTWSLNGLRQLPGHGGAEHNRRARSRPGLRAGRLQSLASRKPGMTSALATSESPGVRTHRPHRTPHSLPGPRHAPASHVSPANPSTPKPLLTT